MCQFCVEHGDGKKWYLQAANYAHDLETDLARRGYIVDFIRNFNRTADRANRYLPLIRSLPRPVRSYVGSRLTRSLQRNHFGQPVPIEECGKVFDITQSIIRIPCVCRRYSKGRDEGYCLVTLTRPIIDLESDSLAALLREELADRDFELPDTSAFELLNKEQALGLMAGWEEEGLMHSVWTFITPFIAAICNCNLQSGCQAMRITLEHGTKVMWKGEHVASVDVEQCKGCRECLPLCPFQAMKLDSKRASVDKDRCHGCGVCRRACGEDAIRLVERESSPSPAW